MREERPERCKKTQQKTPEKQEKKGIRKGIKARRGFIHALVWETLKRWDDMRTDEAGLLVGGVS